MLQLIRILGDGTTIARRNLIKVMRVPEILVAVLVTPLMMVMLFAYVFSGSIDIPGGSYREFLIGGAFALTLTFGATFTGAGLAEDMQNGMIDRFRSLPMSRAAVVVGRTASDMLANVLSLGVMTVAGAPGGVEDPQRLFAEWNPCRRSPRPPGNYSATSRRGPRNHPSGRSSTRCHTRWPGS